MDSAGKYTPIKGTPPTPEVGLHCPSIQHWMQNSGAVMGPGTRGPVWQDLSSNPTSSTFPSSDVESVFKICLIFSLLIYKTNGDDESAKSRELLK